MIQEQRKEASVMNPARLRPCCGRRAKSGAEEVGGEAIHNKHTTKRESGTERLQTWIKRNLGTVVFCSNHGQNQELSAAWYQNQVNVDQEKASVLCISLEQNSLQRYPFKSVFS